MGDRLLTSKELQERLRISERTFWRLLRRGELPYIRVGRMYRFDWEEVKKALSKNKEPRIQRGQAWLMRGNSNEQAS